MDKFHVILLVLLGVAIIFLGISAIQTPEISEILETNGEPAINGEPEVWSTKITPEELNTIADHDWIARLRIIDNTYISGTELICLNICGKNIFFFNIKSFRQEFTLLVRKYIWNEINHNLLFL